MTPTGSRGPGRRSSSPGKGSGSKGSGAHRRRGLAAKGPTPKAEDRVYHAAHKRKVAQDKRATGRGLAKKRERTHEVVAGRNPVVEALRAGLRAARIHMMPGMESDDRIVETLQIAHQRSLKVLESTKRDLDELTDGAAHQGIAMEVEPFAYCDIEDLLDAAEASEQPPLFVVLDGITDPRNVGAIVRSASAFGAHGVVLPERRSASMTAAAWKTSAGTAAYVPIARVTNTVRALERLKSAGVFVVGLDASGETSLPGLAYAQDPVAVVVGAEGKGLGRLVSETCDALVTIPMPGAAESLNASVACGVTLYEIVRARLSAQDDSAQDDSAQG